MNSLIYLRECHTPLRWHSFRMLSRTFPQLSIVETLDEYTSTTSGDGSFSHLNYSSYYNLLINACVRYDAINTSTPSKRRKVYAASGTQDFTIIEEPHKTQFSQDIDKPSDDFIKYIKPIITKSLQTHYLGSRGIMAKTPKKPFKKCDGPVYVPAEVYKLISPEAVVALKKYNTEAINKFAKKRGIHVTDIADHELHPSEDTTPEEQHDPHQFDDAPDSESDPI